MKEDKEIKKRLAVWLYPSTEKRITEALERLDYKSPSEFIEQAVIHYIGYLETRGSGDYISELINKSVKAIVNESTNKVSKNLFRVAYELAMLDCFIATANNYTPEQLDAMRRKALREVKNTNDILRFEKAANFYEDGDS